MSAAGLTTLYEGVFLWDVVRHDPRDGRRREWCAAESDASGTSRTCRCERAVVEMWFRRDVDEMVDLPAAKINMSGL